ncbi:hypothetical protein BV898_17197 [Hypsibius exemplaris]|uniref:Uncharacterized protein n=1 Tax=Hypsibius exemplaris TaxID=2072580 RepID=A0A9X6NGE7_HYPEX|nr:hypothetical protein BV898_17197 [Hypsibius exemplaris]
MAPYLNWPVAVWAELVILRRQVALLCPLNLFSPGGAAVPAEPFLARWRCCGSCTFSRQVALLCSLHLFSPAGVAVPAAPFLARWRCCARCTFSRQVALLCPLHLFSPGVTVQYK